MANNYEYRALGAYKNELFNLLCYTDILSDLLIDLVMPKLDDTRFDKYDNFVGGEYPYYNSDGSKEIVKIKGHLFDVPFVYSTVTDSRNVICMDTNISKCNQSIKEMAVTLYVMCHKDSLMLDSETKKKYRKLGYIGKNRLDIITAIIGDILNHSDINSIGKLQPIPYNPVKPYFPNNDFLGKVLDYNASDFMIDYSSK